MLALAIFCLRLACGLIGSLLILSPAQINPRFYRTHFLIALGLTGLTLASSWNGASIWSIIVLGGAMTLAFAGSVSWSLKNAPGGRSLILLAFLSLAGGLCLVEVEKGRGGEGEKGSLTEQFSHSPPLPFSPPEAATQNLATIGWLLASDFTSAALLGTAMTAMLMGHSYLLAPAMSLTPLLRLLAALLIAILLRMSISGIGLWFWSESHKLTNVGDVTVLWLLVRWSLGFVGPLILCWMTWQTAKIRSTQSATGILYVVVIFCFLGELTGQLLLGHTSITL